MKPESVIIRLTHRAYILRRPKDWTKKYAERRWENLPRGEWGRLVRITRTLLDVMLKGR